MNRLASLDRALKRLVGALDQLEASTEWLDRAVEEKRNLKEGLAAMGDDRRRLTDELEAALARTHALEQATDEVAARLGNAGVTLRRLLEPAEEP